ncbi:MAG TPA: type II and III secretion system protein family protein [Tepidisphaeraceae bacterium]|jgi:pilus assembly protein CpaC
MNQTILPSASRLGRRSAAALMAAALLGLPVAARADAPEGVAAPAATQPVAGGVSLIASGLDANGAGVSMTVGQSRQITTSAPVRAVDVTDPDVVSAKVISPTEIVLTARKTGSAQLMVWDDGGRSARADITVDPDLKAIRAELAKDLPAVRIDVGSANGTVVLRGRVPAAEMADKVVQVATPFAAKVINLLEIGGGQQVTLHVKFAEVSRDAINALGINFGIAGSGGFGANVIGGVEPFGTVSASPTSPIMLGVPSPGANVTQFMKLQAGQTPFAIFINALRENDLLRTLAEPNLTVMSGSQASFLAGGEFPYPVPQSGGAGGGQTTITLDFKQYGVRLNFAPVVLGNGRIKLHVQPEVSDLDYTHSLTLQGFTIPGLTTRTFESTVELAEGQTLSLAGLLQTRVNATNTATPLLADIPVLGALFRSVRYERNETELVVLVTPELAGPLNPGAVPPLPGEQWRYPSEGQFYLNGDLGGPAADAAHAPSRLPPPTFQGSYGFVPATTTPAGR